MKSKMRKHFKKTNISAIVLLAGVLVLGSCSKSFVTKTPETAVLTSQALNTVPLLQSALNGAYTELRAVGQYGRDFPILGDLMADNTYVETRNSGRYLSQYAYTVPVTDAVVDEMWADSYTGILRCNEIIDAPVTGGLTDTVKSQAYAIRAILYFKLVNLFATPYTADSSKLGVPLVLHYNPTLTPGRSSVGQIYTQITSDLIQAMNWAPGYTNSITLSKYAIEGLLARVYLYEGDNPDALNAAADVIQSGGFSLVTAGDLTTFWSNPTVGTSAIETLFEVNVDAINYNGDDDLGGMYDGGYQDIYCSSQLQALYSTTDARAGLIQPGYTKGGYPAWVVVKYPNFLNAGNKDKLKVIRLAEVYLIAAEASALTNPTMSQGYLNTLMANRDPSFPGYLDQGAQLIADIVLERRKELAFEGDRLYDLNRLGQPINRGQNTAAIPAGPGNENLTIPYPDYRRIAPIPQQETLANPVIAAQQNPGY
jgi:starch-binding outer membrane protein, SusD/RagB family